MVSTLTDFINKLVEMSNVPNEDITVKKYDLDNLTDEDKKTIVNTTNKVIKTFADILGIDSSSMLYTTDELDSIIDKYNSDDDVIDKKNKEMSTKDHIKDCVNCNKNCYKNLNNTDKLIDLKNNNIDTYNKYDNNLVNTVLKEKLLNEYKEVNKPKFKEEYYNLIINKLDGEINIDYTFDNSAKQPTVKVIINDYLNLLSTIENFFIILEEIRTELINDYGFSDVYISPNKEEHLIYIYIVL